MTTSRRMHAACTLWSFLLLVLATLPAAASAATIVLRGGASPAFVWCPHPSAQRAACEPAAGVADAAGRSAIDALLSSAKDRPRIALFLSGYRTSFAQGRREADEIARLLGSRVFVVFVDWGSHGKIYDYEGDARAARRSVAAFADFVTALRRAAGTRRIDVYAYSMGTRVVAGAMAVVRSPVAGEPVVDQAVLAAPDLTLNDYRVAITRLPIPFRHVTVYASRADRALLLSSIVHLHHRLGQMSGGRFALQHTDVVDASSADRSTVGHGYPIHDARVICDVAAVFSERPVPHAAWSRSNGVWVLNVAQVRTPDGDRPCADDL